ncbi:Sec-independent protein translocase subunit TatA [Actinomadura sp. WMMB 499]|uniref:Sec-independent protein translocase subunit TatA n=1 Tax=Actinomadura sp. WMMB 499 TaxID=1219491 RepID=UPI001246951C|nr:Sec-independent protein translocase subunit TatA [Actinomadura sp. WMMB 499]QFG19892.1 twin-arginine translocase TatA/TatE family subunit [Actinomadura sp. WMMB 499]
MAGLGTTEILIILAIVLVLFGSAKLPQLARSLGKSARILKAETKGLHDDDDDGRDTGRDNGGTAQASQASQQAPAQDAPGAQQGGRGPQAISSGEPLQGVPVSDPGQFRKS